MQPVLTINSTKSGTFSPVIIYSRSLIICFKHNFCTTPPKYGIDKPFLHLNRCHLSLKSPQTYYCGLQNLCPLSPMADFRPSYTTEGSVWGLPSGSLCVVSWCLWEGQESKGSHSFPPANKLTSCSWEMFSPVLGNLM